MPVKAFEEFCAHHQVQHLGDAANLLI
ncbi:TPA: hypothetical protein ACYYNE_005346 [Escherichia coli]